ncbi:MAG: nucleoside-diphosphate sugar epimerase [Alteromonadaceae bacterium]|nr:MAG: nucleoside-diphosphate sugar epimerase [Alteromonadaceae bacterium]
MVTGANGHLGNNLVRELLERGETVRAGVRDTHKTDMFDGLDCEVVYTEMQDKEAMLKALKGVDVLYHVAAVFKHWAKDPEAEIVRPNVAGAEVVLEAAAAAKVKKVVYVSSVAAVGHNGEPLNEGSWNCEASNAYYRSKIQSERRAWEMAKKYNLWMVTVLPSAMVGPYANRLTDTMQFLDSIRKNTLSVNPNFFFNFVDVRDVAKGIYSAAINGKSGNRYILANNASSSLPEIIEEAKIKGFNFKLPPVLPKWLLYFMAWCLELGATITGKPAELMRSQVKLFYGVRQSYDITKARTELGFEPRSSSVALVDVFRYLEER